MSYPFDSFQMVISDNEDNDSPAFIYLFDPGFELWVISVQFRLVLREVERHDRFFDNDRIPIWFDQSLLSAQSGPLRERMENRIDRVYLLLSELI